MFKPILLLSKVLSEKPILLWSILVEILIRKTPDCPDQLGELSRCAKWDSPDVQSETRVSDGASGTMSWPARVGFHTIWARSAPDRLGLCLDDLEVGDFGGESGGMLMPTPLPRQTLRGWRPRQSGCTCFADSIETCLGWPIYRIVCMSRGVY